MPPTGRKRIQKSKLLIGEGKDELNFLEALLKHLALTDFQVEDCGGKAKLGQYLKEFGKRPGRAKVTAIGITRDVDKSLAQDFQSVTKALTNNQFAAPASAGQIVQGKPAIGVFMFPDNQRTGALEDLCLDAAASDPAFPCVEEFFQCVANKSQRTPAPAGKARMHAWLASQIPPHLRLGEAAFQPWWPWDHAAFDALKQFILGL